MLLLYSFLFTLGILLAAPYYLWRMRGNITCTADWRERLGFLPRNFQQSSRGAIWVHAVSVGETLAVAGLVRQLRNRYPERKIFVSHVTVAGREAGETRLDGIAGQFLLPLDWSTCVRRAMRHIRPDLLVIVETELWPNLLRAAREAGARVIVVNGRISDKSLPRYRWVRSFMQCVLSDVDRISAQSDGDAARFRSLGAAEERVVVTGNLKFDAHPPQSGDFSRALARALAASARTPVVVAASTMAGEEELLVPVWQKVRVGYPRALLILAPRHPARFDEAGTLLGKAFPALARRTRLAAEQDSLTSQVAIAEVLLLDTIGELAGIFELADAVFMGGSLVPTGGHNVLEPAYWATPIVFGPHMHNFRDIAQLLVKNHAAVQVSDAAELGRQLLLLLSDDELRRRMGRAARQVLDEHRGATERVLQIVDGWLGSPAAGPRPAEKST